MKVQKKKRATRSTLRALFAIVVAATSFNCFFYKTGPMEAFSILADALSGKFNQHILGDDSGPAVESQLRKEGYGQLIEQASGRAFDLSFVTEAGRAFDGSPIFHAFYQNSWQGKRLEAFVSDGKLQLHGLCDGNSYNCRYVLPDGPDQSAQTIGTAAPSAIAESGQIAPTGAPEAGLPTIFDEKPDIKTRENYRPGIEPALPVNRPRAEKLPPGGQQVVFAQQISELKERPRKVSNPETQAPTSNPFEQFTIPELVQPWLGRWAGDQMAMNISFAGGKLRVGKSEAKLKGSELVYLKEGTFGRIVWVKLNFSDGHIYAKEENQYGEVLQTAVLKR